MSEYEALAQSLVTNGVTVGALVWFMLRLEKKLDTFTDSINKLTIEVIKLCQQEIN